VRVVLNPGLNGALYKDIPGGVYCWQVTLAKPLIIEEDDREARYKGYIYAGSSSNLNVQRGKWRRWWLRQTDGYKGWRNSTFIWHVLVRDWDTRNSGQMPYDLGTGDVRLGAEQVAATSFRRAAVRNPIYLWGPENVISRRAYDPGTVERMIRAGTQLCEKQLENDAAPGTDVSSGDELNLSLRDRSAQPEILAEAPMVFGGPMMKVNLSSAFLVLFDDAVSASAFNTAMGERGYHTGFESPDDLTEPGDPVRVGHWLVTVCGPWPDWEEGEEVLKPLAAQYGGTYDGRDAFHPEWGMGPFDRPRGGDSFWRVEEGA
jgi:hypothetical protein